MLYKINSFIILALICLIFISCRKKTEIETLKANDPDLLAMVDGREIRTQNFQDELERNEKKRLAALDKSEILQEVILREAYIAKAIEAGLDKDPEVVRYFQNYLIGKFKESRLNPRLENLEITDREIQKFYESKRDKYTVPAKIRLAVLYRSTTSRDSSKIAVEMEEVREQALALANEEEDFGKLAIHHLEDQESRYKGGDLGWIQEDRGHARLDPKAVKAGFALAKIGDVSEVLLSDNGVYLLKLIDRKEESLKSLESVRQAVHFKLIKQKRHELSESFKQDILNSANIETYPEALENVSHFQSERDSNNRNPPPIPK